jgi:hypothetical protein
VVFMDSSMCNERGHLKWLCDGTAIVSGWTTNSAQSLSRRSTVCDR